VKKIWVPFLVYYWFFYPRYARVGSFFLALKNIKILESKNFDACQIKKKKLLKY